MTATDRLNAMQQRCDAASAPTGAKGRWVHEVHNGFHHVFTGPQSNESADVANYVSKDDAAFIAHARTDLPATIAALRAVLDLHGAVQATWATKTGVGPFPFACEECSDVMWVPHPCPTVAAITEALT